MRGRNGEKFQFSLGWRNRGRNRVWSANWPKLIVDTPKLFGVILMQINALRLLKLIPTWELFADGEVWQKEIAPFLDASGQRRYKACWELAVDFTDAFGTDRENLGRLQAVITVMIEARASRKYGKASPVDAGKLPVSPETVDAMRLAVAERYEALFPWD